LLVHHRCEGGDSFHETGGLGKCDGAPNEECANDFYPAGYAAPNRRML